MLRYTSTGSVLVLRFQNKYLHLGQFLVEVVGLVIQIGIYLQALATCSASLFPQVGRR
jgi:hypothetical protein